MSSPTSGGIPTSGYSPVHFGDVGLSKREHMLERRRCTDVLFLFIFFALLGVGGFIAFYAITHGAPAKLFHGYNYTGKLCGVDIVDRPYVYWPVDPEAKEIDTATPLCVKSCFTAQDVKDKVTVNYPKKTVTTSNIPSEKKVAGEEPDVPSEPPPVETGSLEGPPHTESVSISLEYVPSPVYETKPFAGLYCFPADTTKTDGLIQRLRLGSIWMYASRSMEALSTNWYWLLGAGLVGVVIATIYLTLLKYAAKVVIWTVLIVTPLVLIGAGSFLAYMGFSNMSNDVADAMNKHLHGWSGYVGIGIGILGILLIFAISCMHDAINTAVCVMQASLECFQQLPKIMLYPICCITLMCSLVAGGLVVLAYLFTCNELVSVPTVELGEGANGANAIPVYGIHRQFSFSGEVIAYIVCWVFGLIWTIELVNCLMQFTVAFTVALWYFTMPDERGRRGVGCVVTRSFWVAVRYHFGTLALGALLLALFRGLRYLVEFCRKRVDSTGQGNCLTSIICCCGAACTAVVEGFLRLVNASGLVECALSSKGYFSSCSTAFQRLSTDTSSVFLLNGLTAIFSYITSLGISVGIGALLYWMFLRVDAFNEPTSVWYIENPEVVAVLALVVCIILTFIVMLTFDQITDTVLYCYLVEKEERPQALYAPEALRALVEEEDSKQEGQKQRLLEMQEAPLV